MTLSFATQALRQLAASEGPLRPHLSGLDHALSEMMCFARRYVEQCFARRYVEQLSISCGTENKL
jgi:hypothetical protein